MVEEQVVPRKSNMQRLHEFKVPYLSVFVNVWSKDTTALVKNSQRRSFKAQKTLQNLEFRKNWSFEQEEVDLQKLEADSVPKQTKKKRPLRVWEVCSMSKEAKYKLWSSHSKLC